MSERPWYHEGLQFTCSQCGDCCTGAPGFVWVNKAEIEAMAEIHALEVPEFEARFVRQVGIRKSLIELEGGDCIFLGPDRKCTVYTSRPRQCRTWPFWHSNLRSPETWRQTCEVCPGSGRGELVQLEAIERQAAVIRI